jgi:hypothetical protein
MKISAEAFARDEANKKLVEEKAANVFRVTTISDACVYI